MEDTQSLFDGRLTRETRSSGAQANPRSPGLASRGRSALLRDARVPSTSQGTAGPAHVPEAAVAVTKLDEAPDAAGAAAEAGAMVEYREQASAGGQTGLLGVQGVLGKVKPQSNRDSVCVCIGSCLCLGRVLFVYG